MRLTSHRAGIASNLKNDIETQFEPNFPTIWSGEYWPYLTLDQHSKYVVTARPFSREHKTDRCLASFTFNLSTSVKDYPVAIKRLTTAEHGIHIRTERVEPDVKCPYIATHIPFIASRNAVYTALYCSSRPIVCWTLKEAYRIFHRYRSAVLALVAATCCLEMNGALIFSSARNTSSILVRDWIDRGHRRIRGRM